jgi:hypothetical protein
MNRRASGAQEDSLELMLDTICNMFGVIIVAALIAAVLVLARPEESADGGEMPAAPVPDDTVQRLRERVSRLETELEAYPAPEESTDERLATERMSRALAEVARRTSVLDRYRKTIEAAREGSKRLAGSLDSLREEVARLEDSMDAARRSRERQVRTPIEREVDLNLFIIVLWRDRLYPICDLTRRPDDRCEWLRCWNGRYVDASRSTTPVYRCSGDSGINIVRRVVLRPEAGIPVTDAAGLRANPEAIALLRMLKPDQDLVGLRVAPDSFGSFATVKDFFLANGFRYDVAPEESALPVYQDTWISGRPSGM